MMATHDKARDLVAPQRLGLDTRVEFRQTAVQALEALPEGTGCLVIDLSNTRQVDSAGLGGVRRWCYVIQTTKSGFSSPSPNWLVCLPSSRCRGDPPGVGGYGRCPEPSLLLRAPTPVIACPARGCGAAFEGLPMSSERRRRRVLIVEDEPALRLSYERHFNPRYDLVFASTGAEALAKVEAEPPDVAVLDMRLPDTDGVDLLRRIRIRHPTLPVIITTAYMSIEPQLKVLDLPHSGYILKPFRLDELGARIDAVL